MLAQLDARIFHLLYGRESSTLTAIMIAFSLLGSGWSIFIFGPLLAPRRTRPMAAWLVGTLAVAGIIVFSVKAIVQRGRPVTLFPGIRALALDSPTDFSFPSGHATGSFCFALFVTRMLMDAHPRPRHAVLYSAAAILFAACVGVSRIVLGFHFPFDVLGGTVLGSVLGAFGARRYRTWALRKSARNARNAPPGERSPEPDGGLLP